MIVVSFNPPLHNRYFKSVKPLACAVHILEWCFPANCILEHPWPTAMGTLLRLKCEEIVYQHFHAKYSDLFHQPY
jgi:hypothetical protein